jgi:hypothetical protein
VNVRKVSESIIAPAVLNTTKYVKVGDVYVSESVCKAYPKQCEVKPNQTTVAPKVQIPNKRTAAECSAARAKDWEIYCAIVRQEGFEIDCVNANVKAKNEILDNLAEGLQSWQAKCLRGE